ncbi:MAG: GIY-YIG nuclease family protein [Gallionella sp.]|jgi:group I intron endonuclease
MAEAGIYRIENSQNGKCYVGSSVNLSWRWTKHQLLLSRGTHHSKHLQSAWKKYGHDSFSFTPLLICSKENLINYEQRAIDVLKPEYNICKKAGSCLGVVHDEDFRRKLSERYRPPTTPETRQKISKSLMGRTAKPVSEDTKKKISEIAKRRAVGDGRKYMLALAEMKRGVPRTVEVKEKLSKASARLSEDQVRDIRMQASLGILQKDIAPKFGISATSASDIISQRTYRWVA